MDTIARFRKVLSPERQRKIAARTATIVAEARSLQELRTHKPTEEGTGESHRRTSLE